MPALAVTTIAPLAVGVVVAALGAASDGAARSDEVVGRSVEDRPIELRRAGDPGAKAKVLVVGQTHGSEPAGRPVTRDLRRRVHPRTWSSSSSRT